MKLTYQPLKNDEVLRVVCEGHVSLRGKPAAGGEPLPELLGPHGYRQRVILNLEKTDGIDTSGLVWLVRLVIRFAQSGGRLVVYGFSPNFRNTLEVLGMNGTVLTAASEQLAIEAAAQPTDPSPVADNSPIRQLPRFGGR